SAELVPHKHIRLSLEEIERIRATHQVRTGRNWGRILSRVWFWLLIAIIVLYTLFPFYWAVISSLKTSQELIQTPPTFWPKSVTWENYRNVFQDSTFTRAFLNSVIISTSVVVLSLLLGTVAAYAMARLRFRGRTIVLYLILSMTMFPGVAILGSLFQLMKRFHAFNTLWGLIIVYLTFALPFTVWVLTNFFRAMPGDLEEAALVDGASPLQALRQILMPLAIPGMVTTGLLAFIEAWSEFLYAQSFTLTVKAKTVQVAINEFTGNQQYEVPFGTRMAAAVVVTVPLLIGVLLVQRRIVAGLTAGAVKG
ncbi:MAG TPA: carbohydrate ABC transporter permease, partial [Thermomicrobiales bacterium]|nr:carbohydrate ABC transporter permease [Thermomicrobiales bacterium]